MKRGLVVSLLIAAGVVTVFSQVHHRPRSTPSPLTRATPTPRPTPIPEGWVSFNSELGRFSVLMPETPKDETEIVPSDSSPYTTHRYAATGTQSVFLIGWADYDPTFKFNSSWELELNRESFIKGINATLVESRKVTLDGYQAVEFTAQTAARIYKSRVYIVGRRPYLVVAGTNKGVDDSVNVNRFLNSFKVRLP
jgi:hypothetical protein